MTRKHPVPPNPAPLSDPGSPLASNWRKFDRIGAVMVTAGWLVFITALAPAAIHADGINENSTPSAISLPPTDDEEPYADDGSGALKDTFKLYNLENIEPIGAKEEEALLGNWGDADSEDGD